MKILKGTCLCELVKYQIEGDLGPIFNCHCSKCRRWHGAAYRTRASINENQFTWLSSEENLSRFKSSPNATKYFCKNCGSPLITTYEDRPNVLGVALGPLTGDLQQQAQAHIFVASKATWHNITDSLPQYKEWPTNESRVRQTAATD
ncbi:MAG: hypothetical protein ACJATW_001921 [Glaciecola sp.]|jgi:hypothetical protein